MLLKIGRSLLHPFYELCCCAVAFFVFFAGTAGAGVVATYFGACADWLRSFSLCGAGLVLQILLLALLFALELAGDFGKTLGLAFADTRGGASYGGLRASGCTNGTPGISGILSVVPGARRGLGGSWLVSQITSDRERSP